MATGAMPVLVGVGQAVSHWDGTDGTDGAPSPLSLMTAATQRALADTGGADVAQAIDTIVTVRTNETSFAQAKQLHGRNDNLPGTLGREIGATPRQGVLTQAGGQTPQQMVNEFAARIHEGSAECVLISGAEAIGASKAARRNALQLDWSDGSDLELDDRGFGPSMLTRHEIKHGLVSPAYFYGFFQNAMAARNGETRSAHRKRMSDLFAPFTQVAAANPWSQFPIARTSEWLATPSKENYELADPFLKWHIAQDAVNVGAAVLVMSEDKARELGIPEDKFVYLHGAGEAGDLMISEREILDGSWAMEMALSRALDQAEKTVSDMTVFDFYSCFPCAVMAATDALGIDPATETRPLTVTGGLPYFGGPGNNYSLHAIASMTERLRTMPGEFGLVLANGGWMTKEAAGVYSTQRPGAFKTVAPAAKPRTAVTINEAPTTGVIETFTIVHSRTTPLYATISCRAPDDTRFLARVSDPLMARLLKEETCVGLTVSTTQADEVNTASLA